jgi:glyoxylase I family protein
MIGGFHHIDLTVSNLERSVAFYDMVLPLVGFQRRAEKSTPIWGSIHGEIALQPARRFPVHDRYTPGLHHLAFAAPSREAVDRFYARLLEKGFTILDPPAEYPQYATPYYAVFFADPDGLKLELVFSPPAEAAPSD